MTERDIFIAALQKDAADARRAYLAEACGADAALRARVGELLAVHERAASFLESPPVGPAVTIDHAPAEASGAVVGAYKLLEQIGEGGFGVVFMAEQTRPVRRKVALKVLKPGMDTRQVVARFEAERQALAIMDHPNIAKVLDGGVTPSGRPYFVMELVKGVPVTDFCDRNRLAPRQRLELFVAVCQAVQHAHQKGIIHRDLKPSNVLVTVHDTAPVVKVIDFGVAKALGQELTDKTLFTGFAQMIGTPLYMSPEQAGQSGLDIDTRSDIYSLGVLLYELLTGTTPFTKERFQKAAYDEIRRIIREEEPSRPSTKLSTADGLPTLAANRGTEPAKLTRMVRGELDWIVMKALEKDRNRRYETANGFAQDVQRYLADEAVLACPPSAAYRLRKFARRNKTQLTAALLVLAALVLGTGVSIWQAVRATLATASERQARTALDLARSERDRQQARVNRELTGALLEATGLREKARTAGPGDPPALGQLHAALRAARALAADELADPALQQRVQDLVADVDQDDRDRRMVARLEEFLWQSQERGYAQTPRSPVPAHVAGSDWPAYEAAFREYGIPVSDLAVDEAARRIRGSAIRDWLAAALDHCAENSRPLVERLLPIAQRGEDDPWRRQYFAARLRFDRPELVRLAGQPEALDQPPPILCTLAQQVSLPNRSAGVAMLRQAQRRRPADAVLNCALADQLLQTPKAVAERDKWIPLAAEAVGYLRAAVALRPDSSAIRRKLFGALLWSENFAEAEGLSRDEVRARPGDSAGYDDLAEVLFWKKDWDGAIAVFRQSARLGSTSAHTYWALGWALENTGDLAGAIAAYREASTRAPADLHMLASLARALHAAGRLDEAIVAYRRGVDLTPRDGHPGSGYLQGWGSWHDLTACLGWALWDRGDFRAAIDCFEAAIARYEKLVAAGQSVAPADPGHFQYNLAFCLVTCPDPKLRDPARAVGLARQAVAAQPQHRGWRTTLGMALYRAGEYKAAVAEVEKAQGPGRPTALASLVLAMCHHKLGDRERAIRAFCAIRTFDHAMLWFKEVECPSAQADEVRRIRNEAEELLKDSPEVHYTLAGILRASGQLDEAIAEFREATRLKPDFAEAHCDLGGALTQTGEVREALKALRRGHEIGSGRPNWAHPSAAWVRRGERMVELDEKLPGILAGKAQPAGPDERTELAELCAAKQLYRRAVNFYAEAFTADPGLATGRDRVHRYNAACTAALAGCGRGKDADELDDAGRTGLRRRARDWLRADLEAVRSRLVKEPSSPALILQLRHWLEDGDLAGVRGGEALARLPESERGDWQGLWKDVTALLDRANGKPLPDGK